MAYFSDLNQYPYEIAGDRVYGIDAVFQHINNLIAIRPRELLFEPDVGLNVESYLFKPVDAESALGIYAVISEGIRSYANRVTINSAISDVVPVPEDLRFDIKMYLSLSGLVGEYKYQASLYSKLRKVPS